jgi:hypothetical protein
VEAAALVQLNRELAPCRDGVVSSIADPVEASIVAHAIAARQNAYAQLVRGESTWGEYAQASERIGLGAETELARVRSAAAAQQSANAALVLSRGPIFQTPQFQRPTTTNCWYTGSLLNCSTF